MPLKKRSRLILALDEVDAKRALRVAGAVRDSVDAIKVNWPLVLSGGPGTITDLAAMSPVICDFKVADIPNTSRLIARQAFSRGASGIIVHGFTGGDSVRAVVEAAEGGDVYVVTEMSHPGGREFTAPAADRLAQLAVECRAAGVIAPATRPERLARVRSLVGDLLILAPGVGAQGGSATEAIAHGADFVIVGRSIYEDSDPGAAARRIAREIKACPEG